MLIIVSIFVGLVVAFYTLLPLLVLFNQKMDGNMQLIVYDSENKRPPKRAAKFMAEVSESLKDMGFDEHPIIALPSPMPNVMAVCQLWINPRTRDAALVSAIFGDADQGDANSSTLYVEYLSRFQNEEISLIQTNNTQQVSAFAPIPEELTFRFPQVQDPEELYQLHCKLLERHAPNSRKLLSLEDQFAGDLEAYVRWAITDSFRKQEGTGYLVQKEADLWMPTVKGAYMMTWSQLWPMNAYIKQSIRRKADRLLAELGEGD